MKQFKKGCAWVLALTLLVSLFSLTALADSPASTLIPTVYLGGYGGTILADKTDGSSQVLFPVQMPEGFSDRVMNDIKVPLAKGAMLNQWDDFHETVIDLSSEVFGPMALDKDGKASNGSGHPAYIHTYPLEDRKEGDSYPIYAYYFEYDWRLDPFEVAKDLNDYIEAVCDATGAPKVNLFGRCLGCNIILAYLSEYGYARAAQVGFSAAGFNGFEPIGALFSGEMDFNVDSFADYFDHAGRDQMQDGEDPTYDLIVVLLEFLTAAKTLNLAEPLFDSYLVPEFKQYILPELMRRSFGTFPGFWSFIGEEYYDEAMQTIFGGYEEEYAGVIEKANRYHEEIMLRSDEIILNGIEQGVYTYIIVKYGSRAVPIVRDADALGDSTVFTTNSSFGATTSTLYGTFSDDFVDGIMAANGGKYLSPDHQIDASACLLPDHTWFIKNLYHHQVPHSMERMVAELFNFDGYTTIYDLEQYPQYLIFNQDTDQLDPLLPETPAQQAPKYSFFKKLIELFKLIFKVLKNR